ncbi:hypothetical protein [Halosimplex pelagicum]|uniref:Uncharacterized protein n=1 Tax=Halosimplex pelagicum TaxID=869886 RepID=A0A7D5T1F8_9EURY|nr:hypothetical protein [Halosimplex pelagicum]QLH80371.1 hypothetical protein HZS54_01430 [Halosimplex pelagicum]
MGLLEAILVFAVGYVCGAVTRIFAGVAAILALVLAILGVALPASIVGIADPILGVYLGNELLFLSGFLFAIAHDPAGETSED